MKIVCESGDELRKVLNQFYLEHGDMALMADAIIGFLCDTDQATDEDILLLEKKLGRWIQDNEIGKKGIK